MIALAERHTAVHAARSLGLKLLFRNRLRKILPVMDTKLDGTALGTLSFKFHEALGISHGPQPPSIPVSFFEPCAVPTPSCTRPISPGQTWAEPFPTAKAASWPWRFLCTGHAARSGL